MDKFKIDPVALRAHFTPFFSGLGRKAWALALIVLVLDQATKLWMLFGLNLELYQSVKILPFFAFSMVHNIGISFGFFSSTSWGRWVLVLFQFAMAIGLADVVRRQVNPWLATSLGLIVGGALGNGIDRARLGYVVDFIDVSGTHIFPWVFNIADSAITIGVVLLVWYFVRVDGAKAKDATKS